MDPDLAGGWSLVGKWTWEEFQALPRTELTVDIHCVTTWSKLGTVWEGVPIDDLLAAAGLDDRRRPTPWPTPTAATPPTCRSRTCSAARAWWRTRFDGGPLAPEHGGPARLLVPHLYFWKSAKWVRRLRFMEHDEPGFWESPGYHIYGDPWREQRYDGD